MIEPKQIEQPETPQKRPDFDMREFDIMRIVIAVLSLAVVTMGLCIWGHIGQ